MIAFKHCVIYLKCLNNFFFDHYGKVSQSRECTYYNDCIERCNSLWSKIPELPFSHLWIASRLYNLLPMGAVLHLGILSPLRSWGYFPIPSHIEVYCNQGGFGIDGNMSSLLGASWFILKIILWSSR